MEERVVREGKARILDGLGRRGWRGTMSGEEGNDE